MSSCFVNKDQDPYFLNVITLASLSEFTISPETNVSHDGLTIYSKGLCAFHYSDVMMGAMSSQITSLSIVYSTDYSGADQRKHQSSPSLAFVGNSPVPGEFPAQMASNAENVSIWWHHYVSYCHHLHADRRTTANPGKFARNSCFVVCCYS